MLFGFKAKRQFVYRSQSHHIRQTNAKAFFFLERAMCERRRRRCRRRWRWRRRPQQHVPNVRRDAMIFEQRDQVRENEKWKYLLSHLHKQFLFIVIFGRRRCRRCLILFNKSYYYLLLDAPHTLFANAVPLFTSCPPSMLCFYLSKEKKISISPALTECTTLAAAMIVCRRAIDTCHAVSLGHVCETTENHSIRTAHWRAREVQRKINVFSLLYYWFFCSHFYDVCERVRVVFCISLRWFFFFSFFLNSINKVDVSPKCKNKVDKYVENARTLLRTKAMPNAAYDAQKIAARRCRAGPGRFDGVMFAVGLCGCRNMAKRRTQMKSFSSHGFDFYERQRREPIARFS